jgi:hypothetical protein
MFWDIIFWITIIYIGGVVLWHLFFLVLMIFEGYSDGGFFGAVGSAIGAFIFGTWNLAKFALGILIFALIIRACSGKDYVGYDKANLKVDVNFLVYFYNDCDINHIPEYNERLAKFKKRISDYSEDEIKKIKDFSHTYISFSKSSQDDFVKVFLDYQPHSEFTFQYSSKTLNLKSKLLSYDIKERIELEDKEMDKIVIKLKEELPRYTEDELFEIKDRARTKNKDIPRMMSYVYKNIFGEDLKYE